MNLREIGLFRGQVMLVAFGGMMLSGVAFAAADGWERPQTTRRYVQGPLAERVIVSWREGKVTVGEVRHEHDWRRSAYDRPETTPQAFGAWLLQGPNDVPFDFTQAKLRTEADATPIHGQHWRLGDLKVDFETCAPFGRRPSANLRITVTNEGTRTLVHGFALMLRSAEERQLVFSAPDLYDVYRPRVGQWRSLASTWAVASDGVWKDGARFVTAASGVPLAWDAERGAVRFEVRLAPGESQTADFVLGEGAPEHPDYERRRSQTRADWQRELSRVDGRPALVRFMTVQMLQCFSRAVGRDDALPRQGGLQCWVWPGDQKHVSAALGVSPALFYQNEGVRLSCR